LKVQKQKEENDQNVRSTLEELPFFMSVRQQLHTSSFFFEEASHQWWIQLYGNYTRVSWRAGNAKRAVHEDDREERGHWRELFSWERLKLNMKYDWRSR